MTTILRKTFIAIVLPVALAAGEIDDRLQRISTLVSTLTRTDDGQVFSGQATAFFYQELGPSDPNAHGPQWRSIKNIWLITNRHVVLPKIKEKEYLPIQLVFNLRKNVGSHLEWEGITLDRDELIRRARFHRDAGVDVCAISILDLVQAKALEPGNSLQPWESVTEEDLPGVAGNKFTIQVASDAIVLGYPKGYYDDVNLFPIVKSGIVASRWGAQFSGRPYFLIDARLFPGSSGSLVISKPTDVIVSEGQLLRSQTGKQFAFLGVYSGEPYRGAESVDVLPELTITTKSMFNLGIVWYGSLIGEIIRSGAPYSRE